MKVSVCLPGFTGLLCENVIDNCTGIVCKNGGGCVNGSCYCGPGFIGAMCEFESIVDCIGVACSGRGVCVDGIQNFSCNCEPGYTGSTCETG